MQVADFDEFFFSLRASWLADADPADVQYDQVVEETLGAHHHVKPRFPPLELLVISRPLLA
jgi:hypothetical protein